MVAALAVMVSHAYALSGNSEPMPYAERTLGTYAVCVFFAISGFLVTRSWNNDPSVARFFSRRVLRIAPAYLAAITLVPALLWLAGRTDFTGNPWSVVNGSLWTIPLEVQCYMAFLVLAAITRAVAVGVVIIGHDSDLMRFAGFFAMGALSAQYALLRLRLVRALLLVLGAYIASLHSAHYGTVLALTTGVLWIGESSTYGLRAIGRQGDLSYGVYLYAFPAQQLVILLLDATAPYAVLLFCAFCITFPAAWLSWQFIERPALRLRSRLQSSSAIAARAVT